MLSRLSVCWLKIIESSQKIALFGRQLKSWIIGNKTADSSENITLQESYFFTFASLSKHQTMRFLVIFPFLIVTLLAGNQKYYLVEVKDKNENKNNVNDEEKNVEPRKVFKQSIK